MKEFLEHITPFMGLCMLTLMPIATVIVVELLKAYTNITKIFKPHYLAWLIATVFWLIAIAVDAVNVENHIFINVIVPGILIGMISNSYYDAFVDLF